MRPNYYDNERGNDVEDAVTPFPSAAITQNSPHQTSATSNSSGKKRRRKRSKGGSFDTANQSDLTPLTPNRRRRRRKRTNGGSFDEQGPLPEVQRRKKRSPNGGVFDDSGLLPETHGKYKKNSDFSLPKNAPGYPVAGPPGADIRNYELNTNPMANYATPRTEETPINPIVRNQPPPGLGFADPSKQRRRRKKRRGGGRAKMSGLFSGVNFFNVRKFYELSHFASPKHRETNKPNLYVQEVDEEERIEEISLTDKNVYNRVVNKTPRTNMFSTTLAKIDPRQLVSVQNLPWNYSQPAESSLPTERKSVDNVRCCPPCFYVLFFLLLIIVGAVLLVLAFQGEFDD